MLNLFGSYATKNLTYNTEILPLHFVQGQDDREEPRPFKVEVAGLIPRGYTCDLINEAKTSWLHLFNFSGLKPRGYIYKKS